MNRIGGSPKIGGRLILRGLEHDICIVKRKGSRLSQKAMMIAVPVWWLASVICEEGLWL
jgi:hypothetical protein